MSNFDVINIEEKEFLSFYSDKLKEIDKNKLDRMEPKRDEQNTVRGLIINFVKEKKRKIYGGYAWNKLFIDKDKKYAIYDENDSPDIDFYSYEPLTDIMTICDMLHEKGYTNIDAKEGVHKETYRIYVNYQLYCDLTYMPRNIYNNVRFLKIDGFHITHPWFMMVDFFRMLTDPMISWWRFDKHFKRFLLLQKLYPLPKTKDTLMLEGYENEDTEEIINKILEMISKKDNMLVTGFYAYNYYVHETGEKGENKYIDIPYIEAYTDEYRKDGMEFIEKIKELNSDITHKEFNPFFNLYGYNCVFYHKGNPIFYLYSHQKCLPFKKVNFIKFIDGKGVKQKGKINIGSFDVNILQALIILVKVRVDDDKAWNDVLYKLINGFVNLRNLYLKQNKIKAYDDSIVASFVTDCMGNVMTAEKERGMLIQSRIKKKKPLVIRYKPGVDNKNFANYMFQNSSGNEIRNEKGLKLVDNKKESDDGDDSEENNSNNGEEDNVEDNIEDDV
jgi:hypothetical protein